MLVPGPRLGTTQSHQRREEICPLSWVFLWDSFESECSNPVFAWYGGVSTPVHRYSIGVLQLGQKNRSARDIDPFSVPQYTKCLIEVRAPQLWRPTVLGRARGNFVQAGLANQWFRSSQQRISTTPDNFWLDILERTRR